MANDGCGRDRAGEARPGLILSGKKDRSRTFPWREGITGTEGVAAAGAAVFSQVKGQGIAEFYFLFLLSLCLSRASFGAARASWNKNV